MEDYKPNSHKSKEQNLEERKKIEKVVTGPVKIKKKGELRKLADVFIPEDVSSVKNFVLTDVIIPAAKKIVTDVVDAFLYPGGSPRDRHSGVSNISYRKYSDRRDDGRSYRDGYSQRNSGYSHDDIVVTTRGEAEEILTRMDELIETYGVVTIADVYDLIGKTCQYTDNKYGWTNIRNAEPIRVRDGYLIKLPKALPID